MARRNISHRSASHLVADDTPHTADLRYRAILRTRVFDELTLAPPASAISVRSNLRSAVSRVGAGGVCGLVARPRDVEMAMLASGGLTASIEAEGYLPLDLTTAIDAARYELSGAAGAGHGVIDVAPRDDRLPAQFRAGRGLFVRGAVPGSSAEYQIVGMPGATDAPQSSSRIPLTSGLRTNHADAASVVGVPIVLPDQALHRAGVARIQGRVRAHPDTGLDGTNMLDLTSTRIGVAGVWFAYPQIMTESPRPPEICSISPSLRIAHEAGTALRSCALEPSGPSRELAAHAEPGSMVLEIQPADGLRPAGGDVLQIGDPLDGDSEFVVSSRVEPVPGAGARVRVSLNAGTAHRHRMPCPVRMQSVSSPADVGQLSRSALVGDRTLFANGLDALPAEHALTIGAGAHATYYRANRYPRHDGQAFVRPLLATHDGAFALPLSRIAGVRIAAQLGEQGRLHQIDVPLDYDGVNTVTLELD